MMTMQEVFNTSVLGVIGQGGRSTGENGVTCLYRGPNGRKCAVGWLIKDEFYQPELEGKRITALAVDKALTLSGVDTRPKPMWLLSALQRVHDSAEDLADFIARARNVAAYFGLTFPEAVT